jgi:NAD(P)H-dependent FMN reductase
MPSSKPHQSPRLLFIAGSAREASFNKRLARLGAQIADANGIAATFADLGDYPMPLYDGDLEAAEGPPENAKKLKHLMGLHNGVFIAAPEYNSSITPLLKNTLDWVSRVREGDEQPNEVFKTRVFALGSASPGGMGGLRGLNTVRQVLELGLGALVLPEQFAVPRAADAFEANGHLKNKESQATFKAMIQKLARAGHVLHG